MKQLITYPCSPRAFITNLTGSEFWAPAGVIVSLTGQIAWAFFVFRGIHFIKFYTNYPSQWGLPPKSMQPWYILLAVFFHKIYTKQGMYLSVKLLMRSNECYFLVCKCWTGIYVQQITADKYFYCDNKSIVGEFGAPRRLTDVTGIMLCKNGSVFDTKTVFQRIKSKLFCTFKKHT